MAEDTVEQKETIQNEAPQGSVSLNPKGQKGVRSSLFNSLAYLKKNYMEPVSVLGAILLGTTALTTPLLTAVGPFAAMAGPFAVAAAALYLLAKNSDVVCDNAETLGGKMKISAITIGAILGSMTALPELFVTFDSIAKHTPSIGLGTIIGANIYNTLAVLGVTASIAAIPAATGLSWKFNTACMLGATAAFGTLVFTGAALPMVAGIGLLGGLAAWAVSSALIDRHDQKVRRESGLDIEDEEADESDELQQLPKLFHLLWGAAGVGGLIFASDLLVKSAITLAHNAGASDALVAALVVAGGTSLPELAVNVTAALKKNTQMAIGNILGSKIVNILLIGGVLALAKSPIPEDFQIHTNNLSSMGTFNAAVFGGAALWLGASLFANKGGLKRWQGYVSLAAFAAYAGVLVTHMVNDPNPQKIKPPEKKPTTAMMDTAKAIKTAGSIIKTPGSDKIYFVPPRALATQVPVQAPL